jgi:hypothetical protein
MRQNILRLRLSKTSQIILEEFARVRDWEKVKKNLKVTDNDVATARRVAARKILSGT